MRRLWLAGSAAITLTCAGRTTREAERRAALLTEVPSSLPPEACEVVLTPLQLPPADLLVDSVALTHGIARVWAKQEFSSGRVLLTLMYDGQNRNTRLFVLEHDVTRVAADSTRWLVKEALRSLEREAAPDSSPEPPGWGVRLRLDIDAEGTRVRVGRQEYCPPRPRNPEVERALEGIQAEGVRYRQGRRERTIFMNVLVHPAGYVTRATVSRGVPLTTTLEQRLVDFVTQFSFFPALLDGEPVEGWIEIPVRIRD